MAPSRADAFNTNNNAVGKRMTNMKPLTTTSGPKINMDKVRDTAVEYGKKVITDKAAELLGLNSTDVRTTLDTLNQFIDYNNSTGADKFIDRPKLNNDNGGGSGLSGGVKGRLNYNGSPIEVNLNTGIKPNCYTSIYEEPRDNTFSPLKMVGLQLKIPDDSTELGTFFDKIVSFQFQNSLQRAVSFSINTEYISGNLIRNSMNHLLYALAVYVWFDSILTYSNNPLNRNEAIQAIRDNISADSINMLTKLRYILSGTPIPPNMKSFVYYFYQTFRDSDLPHGRLIKFSPVTIDSVGSPDINTLTNAIAYLNESKYTYSLIARACPRWCDGTLPSSNAAPLYDKNFLTMFANSPFMMQNAGQTDIKYQPINSSIGVPYGTYTDNLDGIAYACMAVRDSASGSSRWLPSLVDTVNYNMGGAICNKIYYRSAGFDVIPNALWSSLSTGYTYTGSFSINSPAGATFSVVPPHSQPVDNVNAKTITESCYKAVEWLMTLDSIGAIKDNREYNIGLSAKTIRSKRKGG